MLLKFILYYLLIGLFNYCLYRTIWKEAYDFVMKEIEEMYGHLFSLGFLKFVIGFILAIRWPADWFAQIKYYTVKIYRWAFRSKYKMSDAISDASRMIRRKGNKKLADELDEALEKLKNKPE